MRYTARCVGVGAGFERMRLAMVLAFLAGALLGLAAPAAVVFDTAGETVEGRTFSEPVVVSAVGVSFVGCAFEDISGIALDLRADGGVVRACRFDRIDGWAVHIVGDGVEVVDSDFDTVRSIDGSWEGIAIGGNVGANASDVIVSDNRIVAAVQGIVARGRRWTVTRNRVERPTKSGRADADYSRAFGDGHSFTWNYFAGATVESMCPPGHAGGYDGIVCSHTDGVQTFGWLTNFYFGFNYVQGFIQGALIQDTDGDSLGVSDILIEHNVFVGGLRSGERGGSWGVLVEDNTGLGGPQRVVVRNNVFAYLATFGVGARYQATLDAYRNILYDVQLQYHYRGAAPGGFTPHENLRYLIDLDWKASGDVDLDPELLDPLDFLGPDGTFGTADDGWRPQHPDALAFGPQIDNVLPDGDVASAGTTVEFLVTVDAASAERPAESRVTVTLESPRFPLSVSAVSFVAVAGEPVTVSLADLVVMYAGPESARIVSAEAPIGWAVGIDVDGQSVTFTPAGP